MSTQTRFGAIWSVRLMLAIRLAGALIAFVANATAVVGWRGAALVSIAAALIGSLAWAGHAAGTRGCLAGCTSPLMRCISLQQRPGSEACSRSRCYWPRHAGAPTRRLRCGARRHATIFFPRHR